MEEKTCKNCAWYSQHYVKKPGRLIAISCGSCLKSRNKHFEAVSCEKWKQTDTQKEKECLYAKLKAMSTDIHDIALILKNDN